MANLYGGSPFLGFSASDAWAVVRVALYVAIPAAVDAVISAAQTGQISLSPYVLAFGPPISAAVHHFFTDTQKP